MQFDHSPLLEEIWLIYLRKSRQDDPNQTVEEVLEKHEAMLQEYAERELGHRIPEENIYREVVSGESIDERVEVKKVLARIEDPAVTGVLVVEPSRLSRGDLSDCARIIDAFRFTHSLIATPMMTYNLEKKMERKFFQDELLRGNDYLEYTKEILFRGRIAAAKRGCYVPAIPPYGYDRVKIGKDWTLAPNENADAVRMSFDWFVKEGLSPGKIARRLNEMGYTPTRGKDWTRESVYGMLNNIHYIGKIKYNEFKATWVLENGKRVKKMVKQPKEDIILVEGKHPALIDKEIFDAAKNRMSKNPKLRNSKELKNPLASVLRCGKCGYSLTLDVHSRMHSLPRFKCRRYGCMKSARASEVYEGVIFALEQVELPKLQTKLKNGEGDAAAIQKRRIDKLVKQLAEFRDQEEQQYDLLETRKYTQEVFDRRNAALRKKMDACEEALHNAKAALPQNIDYADKIMTLEETIAALKDDEMPNAAKNRMLRSIVDRIEMLTEDLGHQKTGIKLDVFLRL